MNDAPELTPPPEASGLAALAHEPLDDDVDLHTLIDRQQRGPLPRVTKALIAAVVVAVAFFAGSLVQQHFGPASASPGQGFPGLAGLRGPGGFSPNSLGGADPGAAASGSASAVGLTVGTVTLVDGNHVYVTDASGAITKVNVTGTTAITVSAKATAKQLKAGQQVLVRGEAASDGTVTATTITQGSVPSGVPALVNGN